jgi:hypothetical protein
LNFGLSLYAIMDTASIQDYVEVAPLLIDMFENIDDAIHFL